MKERVCLDIDWADVDGTVFAGHVGTATEAGPVVVTLSTGSFAGTDAVSGCVDADRELILDIVRDPEDYYVNVHSRRPTPPAPSAASWHRSAAAAPMRRASPAPVAHAPPPAQ